MLQAGSGRSSRQKIWKIRSFIEKCVAGVELFVEKSQVVKHSTLDVDSPSDCKTLFLTFCF